MSPRDTSAVDEAMAQRHEKGTGEERMSDTEMASAEAEAAELLGYERPAGTPEELGQQVEAAQGEVQKDAAAFDAGHQEATARVEEPPDSIGIEPETAAAPAAEAAQQLAGVQQEATADTAVAKGELQAAGEPEAVSESEPETEVAEAPEGEQTLESLQAQAKEAWQQISKLRQEKQHHEGVIRVNTRRRDGSSKKEDAAVWQGMIDDAEQKLAPVGEELASLEAKHSGLQAKMEQLKTPEDRQREETEKQIRQLENGMQQSRDTVATYQKEIAKNKSFIDRSGKESHAHFQKLIDDDLKTIGKVEELLQRDQEKMDQLKESLAAGVGQEAAEKPAVTVEQDTDATEETATATAAPEGTPDVIPGEEESAKVPAEAGVSGKEAPPERESEVDAELSAMSAKELIGTKADLSRGIRKMKEKIRGAEFRINLTENNLKRDKRPESQKVFKGTLDKAERELTDFKDQLKPLEARKDEVTSAIEKTPEGQLLAKADLLKRRIKSESNTKVVEGLLAKTQKAFDSFAARTNNWQDEGADVLKEQTEQKIRVHRHSLESSRQRVSQLREELKEIEGQLADLGTEV